MDSNQILSMNNHVGVLQFSSSKLEIITQPHFIPYFQGFLLVIASYSESSVVMLKIDRTYCKTMLRGASNASVR